MKSLSILSVMDIALDSSNDRLGTVSSTKLQLVSTITVNSLNQSVTLPSAPQPLSYNQGLFYVDIFPVSISYTFHMYSAINLTKVSSMIFTQSGLNVLFGFSMIHLYAFVWKLKTTSPYNFTRFVSSTTVMFSMNIEIYNFVLE